MHTIDLGKYSLRTDLIIENNKKNDYTTKTKTKDNITIEKTESKNNEEHYTTISFDDVTDKTNFQKVEEVLIDELKPYIESLNIDRNDTVLVVGLGNSNSTPDSLGPEVIRNTLVTKHLYSIGEVDDNYQCVAAISPEVTATTGIETSENIKALIKASSAKALIIIDALAASSINRVNKTIQITNTGIHPGSGVGNNRKELSKKTTNIPVIAIGIPTIVDAVTIVSDTFRYMQKQFSYKLNNINNNKLKLIPVTNQDYTSFSKELELENKKEILGEIGTLSEEDFKQLIYEVLSPINYNMMVTPTEIDFIVERLSLLIANSINKTLHKNFTSTKN